MNKVYLLWIHDCILDVFGSLESALKACDAYRNSHEFKNCVWKSHPRVDGIKWYTDDLAAIGHWPPSVSRLEVEPHVVTP